MVEHNIIDKTLWIITLAMPHFQHNFITLLFLQLPKTCVMSKKNIFILNCGRKKKYILYKK